MLERTLERARSARRWYWPYRMGSGLNLLARIGIKPATIVDVGASDGRWSSLALKSFPSADLLLFEPQPVHAPGLARFQNKHPDARVLRTAVGGASGISAFDARDPQSGVLQEGLQPGSITVSVVTLDEALEGARPPFLVKLDTHGVEPEILAGARETLARSVGWVIEAYNYRVTPDCLLFWELCARMTEHGFRPVDLADVLRRPYDETLWQMDVFFIRSDWAGFGYLGYT
jgi:FkbM family methyltransferase